jgi:hypothetical protein
MKPVSRGGGLAGPHVLAGFLMRTSPPSSPMDSRPALRVFSPLDGRSGILAKLALSSSALGSGVNFATVNHVYYLQETS